MKVTRIRGFLILLAVFVLTATACDLGTTTTFADLPAPAGGKYPTSQFVQKVGDTEQVSMISPLLAVYYNDTGKGAGGTNSEIATIDGNSAVMTEFVWGDYLNGKIKSTEVFDVVGNLIESRITLQVDSASILQWFGGCFGCTIDRSRLVLQYFPDETGWPRLSRAVYLEEWGTNSKDILALGQAAYWDGAAEVFPAYASWGFWESHSKPFDQVVGALEAARTGLQTVTPTYKVADEDSLSEIIGRQTGLKLYKNGEAWGAINFTYSNNWGRMPNTEYIGKGALSRVEWTYNGEYRALSVLSSNLSPQPTTVYVFSNSAQTASLVESTDWVPLYAKIRNGELPDVFLAVYSAGFVGKISQTVSTSDGSSTVDIGEGGGVYYSVLGNPTASDIVEAHNLIDMMGRGGIKASGFYYATSQASGNGLLYYLAALKLITADKESVLNEYGIDVGVLDRVGFPDLP